MAKYWVIVLSKDHANIGLSQSCIQACHGKYNPLNRMHEGDGVLLYSPKLNFQGKDKYQKFVAFGYLADDNIFQVELSENFHPFRRIVNYMHAGEVGIFDVLDNLTFIRNKSNWGFLFRTGCFEIPKKDFDFIIAKMIVN